MQLPECNLDRRLCLVFPSKWIDAIDYARGDLTRAAYIRSAVESRLRRAGFSVGKPAERRGKYSRRDAGLMGPKMLRRLEEREARAARRAQRQSKVKEVPPVSYSFTSSGDVVSSDMIGAGGPAGWVDSGGVYHRESRHEAVTVQKALREQMASDPDRKWDPRYLLFAQREQV